MRRCQVTIYTTLLLALNQIRSRVTSVKSYLSLVKITVFFTLYRPEKTKNTVNLLNFFLEVKRKDIRQMSLLEQLFRPSKLRLVSTHMIEFQPK